ncbi:hypothetical protein C8R43DRAFT_1136190 [Mycena crocata]|nr:hypothetical protein C8R43DRAFT_1136190 [Mycena crocata]
MEPPSSPFRLSPSSACSSTLIITPTPLPPVRGPAAKGPLQPHITNLPRRRRPMATLRISAPPSSASPKPPDSTYLPSPIQLPSLPPFPISPGFPPPAVREGPTIAQPRGPVQPAHGNVPRRAKPLSETQLRARRRRERCVQELGRASGVFVAFPPHPLDTTEEDEDEFDAVVRISPAEDGGSNAKVVDKGGGATMSLVTPGTRDDGVPSLTAAQLRAACAFVWAHQADGRRVLITAPRAYAVDAMSVGVCCGSRSVESARASPRPHELEGGDGVDADADRVHRLVMRWHDLPSSQDDEDDDFGGGLKDDWRGLLSHDGIYYLAAALRAPTLSHSRPSSPLPPLPTS